MRADLIRAQDSLVDLLEFLRYLLGAAPAQVHDGEPEPDVFVRVLLAQEAGELGQPRGVRHQLLDGQRPALDALLTGHLDTAMRDGFS